MVEFARSQGAEGRVAWNHDGMGPFVFDLERYLDALRGPKPAPASRT
jgi:hypothetical protein